MDTEANKELVRRFVDRVLNTTDVEAAVQAATELWAPDFRVHGLAPERALDRDGALAAVRIFHAAFPDWHEDIDDLVAEGDRVGMRFTSRGTHRGEFLGVPATGRAVVVSGIAMYRLAGGRIAEDWLQMDALGLLRQLGGLPGAGTAGAALYLA